MNKKMKFAGLMTLSLTLATLTTGCFGDQKQAEAEKLPPVKIATAHSELVEQQAEYTGAILPYLENNISPSMGLRIDEIRFDVGDKVRRGQTLVVMDKRQYLQAAVQYTNLKTDYDRMATLYTEGGVSKQQLDQLETQLTVAKHAADNLKENTDLLSPISGVVTKRTYDPGDMYSPAGGGILTIMQLDRVKVLANVSEQHFTEVKVGMPVDITLEVYPGETFHGKVSLIHPALDAATRTFTAEITIPNSDMRLRPGMFSRVTLNFGKLDNVLIPDVAVQKQVGSNERYVFVMKADNTVERRTVTLGRVVGKEYEILSGVNDKETVIVAGGSKLLSGGKVVVTK